MMCPNGAMTRMAGGNGGEGSDKGCQCVPDFLMAMVMQAPAGRSLDRSSGSFKQQTATAQREVFKKQKVKLGKKNCMCDFDLKMNTKCSGKATCDKKCSGTGTVEIKGCSFTLKMKKGKGSISNCACAASPTEAPAPTGTGSGSGNGGEGSGASRCACVSKGMGGTGPSPPTGSGSGPAPTGSGSGSGPAPTGSGSGSEPAPPTGSGSGSGEAVGFFTFGDYGTKFTEENQEILETYGLMNKRMVKDQSVAPTSETIGWTQISRCLHWCEEEYLLVDYYEDGNKTKEVMKVFVARSEVSPPDEFWTSGYHGYLHFGFLWFGEQNQAVFFVLHPNSWGPYQHRFKTNGFTDFFNKAVGKVTAMAASGLATSAIAGAAFGSIVPFAGPVIGGLVGIAVGSLSDDYMA